MQNLQLNSIEMHTAHFKAKGDDIKKSIAEVIVWNMVNGVDVELAAENKIYNINQKQIIETILSQCQD